MIRGIIGYLKLIEIDRWFFFFFCIYNTIFIPAKCEKSYEKENYEEGKGERERERKER